MKPILVVGELNVDLVLEGVETLPAPGTEVLAAGYTLTLGSASAICAMGLARLSRRVSFVSTVGCDAWGVFCIAALNGRGIDASRVVQDSSLQTGITVAIPMGGDRRLVTYPGATRTQTADRLDDELLSRFRHVHVSSFYLQAGLRPGCRDLFARASRLGLTTSLDPGFDPTERWDEDIMSVLGATDLFFPNEIELAGITGLEQPAEGLERLQNGRTTTVVKLGGQGCLALVRGEQVSHPAFPVAAVDTTGAGDSFNAGFLHAWLDGRPPRACLRYGAACGALSTRGAGGVDAQPTASELDAFLQAAS